MEELHSRLNRVEEKTGKLIYAKETSVQNKIK